MVPRVPGGMSGRVPGGFVAPSAGCRVVNGEAVGLSASRQTLHCVSHHDHPLGFLAERCEHLQLMRRGL